MHKAVFLDRDGVINIDHGYIVDPDEFEFIDGVMEACEKLQQLGYLLVIVTNQSGVARGYYSEEDVAKLHQWLHGQFALCQIRIAGIYYCPHHPNVGLGEYHQHCDCRKPEPGMLLAAAKDLDIDLSQSIIIGDKQSDMRAGEKAGIGECILVGNKEPIQGAPYPHYSTLNDYVQLKFG